MNGWAVLRAPRFEDPETTARAATLWPIVLVFAISGLVTLASITVAGLDPPALVLSCFTTGLWLYLLVLLRRGRVEAVARLLSWGLWGILAGSVVMSGGIGSASMISFVVAILAAGLLIHGRAALAMAALTAAFSLGLILLGSAGVQFPVTFQATPLVQGLIFVTSFIAAGVVIAKARQQIEVNLELSRRYEQELRQAQKLDAVGRLAGGVAHDFNNLLTGILGFNEIVIHETSDRPDARSAALEVQAAAESASELTAQLLAFSRRPAEKTGATDLNATIHAVDAMLGRLLGADIDVVLELEDGLPPIVGKASSLEQVVINLALNARDAMPAGGRLAISTQSLPREADGGDRVLLRVADTGEGMTPEVAAHAFEPFFTTRRDASGTGLGLSSVYGIVQQSGGTIRLESEPGAGTRFDIRLPVSTAAAGPSVAAVRRPPTHPLQKKRVLLAEDDERVRQLILGTLERGGHDVFAAGDAEEAFALFERERDAFDLLITDVVMPGADGIDLMERVRGQRPDLRVLLISGYPSRPGEAGHAIPESVPFLQKPFGPLELEHAVIDVFGEAETGA